MKKMKKIQTAALLLLTAGLLLLGSCGSNDNSNSESEKVSPSQITVTRSASPKFYADNGSSH